MVWNRLTTRSAAAVMLATALLSASAPVSAVTDEERAGARAAATEGALAMQQMRYADAVDLFTRAESLVHAPPHLLFLARAYEKLGKLVKARETYQKLTRETLPATAPKAFATAQTDGNTELAALEPRVPTLKITIKGAVPNIVVNVDGSPMPTALIGVPRPTDPGEHKVQATGPGVASDIATVVLKEGSKQSVELEMKPSGAAPVPTPGSTAAASAAPAASQQVAPVASGDTAGPAPTATTPGKDTGTAPKKSNTLRTASYVSLGVGVVGVVVGGIFASQSHKKRVEGDDLCPNGQCPMSNKSKIDDLDKQAQSAGQIAVTGFIVGGAALATGITLFIVSGKKKDTTAAAHTVTPWVGLGSAGLSGTF